MYKTSSSCSQHSVTFVQKIIGDFGLDLLAVLICFCEFLKEGSLCDAWFAEEGVDFLADFIAGIVGLDLLFAL